MKNLSTATPLPTTSSLDVVIRLMGGAYPSPPSSFKTPVADPGSGGFLVLTPSSTTHLKQSASTVAVGRLISRV